MQLLRFIAAITYVLFYADSKSSDVFIIRDAEIEEILTNIAVPIFSAAKLNPKTVKVYLVDSNTINAFTIGNGYIFINSGLILKFSNPLQLIGVLCHEIGHIAAGHVNKIINKISTTSKNITIATIAGMIGAVLTKSNELMGLLIGYTIMEERSLMHYSREQELEADSLAASYITKMGYDVNILIDVFRYFEKIEIIEGISHVPTYIRSHPKSIDRINAIKKINTGTRTIPSNDLLKNYKRLRLKLQSYSKQNNWQSQIPNDPYAKAIYLHRNGKSNEAINILKELISNNKNEIYYKDTLAQIFHETGQPQKAAAIYKTLCKNNAHVLIKIAYARAILDADLDIDKAISLLESAKYMNDFNDEIFRLLAKAYGKKARYGISFFMLAREQMLQQNYEQAYKLIEKSIKLMDPKKDITYLKKAKFFSKIIKRTITK